MGRTGKSSPMSLSLARILSASFLEDTARRRRRWRRRRRTAGWVRRAARRCGLRRESHRGGSLVCHPSPFRQRLPRSVPNMTRLRSRPLGDTGFIPIRSRSCPSSWQRYELLSFAIAAGSGTSDLVSHPLPLVRLHTRSLALPIRGRRYVGHT